jgi:hypothetical protein
MLQVLEGIKEDIVYLPVLESVAVQQQHKNWANEVMLDTWWENLGGAGIKIKADLL